MSGVMRGWDRSVTLNSYLDKWLECLSAWYWQDQSRRISGDLREVSEMGQQWAVKTVCKDPWECFLVLTPPYKPMLSYSVRFDQTWFFTVLHNRDNGTDRFEQPFHVHDKVQSRRMSVVCAIYGKDGFIVFSSLSPLWYAQLSKSSNRRYKYIISSG
jgi:hypothetical protein